MAGTEAIYFRAPEDIMIQIERTSLCHQKGEVGSWLGTAAAPGLRAGLAGGSRRSAQEN